MDVPTITMDPDVAREKLDAWMHERHADAREAREACIVGYQALAEGKTLLQLDTAIAGGGFFASGLPKLAIARADRSEVRCAWRDRETTILFDARDELPRGRPVASLVRRVDVRQFHGMTYTGGDGRQHGRWLEGYAQVPMLPAEVRPSRGQLKDWFILWEVERWADRRFRVEPDRDPLLLEHVAGQLYAVLAEWELTDLERAVMAGALRPEPPIS